MRRPWHTAGLKALCLSMLLAAAPLGAQTPELNVPARRAPTDAAALGAFLDGVMVAHMRDKHIAGATVSVVRDGELLLSKGYGWANVGERKPVDPARTMFRIGSVTKLFTWTA